MNDAVIIAGGGTVGLMLAHELGLAGVETVVLERHDRQRLEAPAFALNSSAVELLAQRGLMDSFGDEYMELPIAQFAHIWLDPVRLSERHPYIYGIPQAHLELRLAEAAGKRGVDIRRGHEVVGVSQDATGVTVEVLTGSGRYSIHGGYLVGCDGAKSIVRDLAGIDFAGTDYPFYGITGEVEVKPGSGLLTLLQPDSYPAGALGVVPGGPDVIRVLMGLTAAAPGAGLRLRILTSEFERTPPDPDVPVTAAELSDRIEHITGEKYDLGTPLWLARWQHSVRQADRYRQGRVFLAGDAAHVHFPLGGQALSTGIEDAVNLGWKLGATINGWAPDRLLDTYHEERYPVGARACQTTQAQVLLLHPWERVTPLRDVLAELIRFDDVNEYFVTMVSGLDVRYPIRYPGLPKGANSHPLLGRRITNITVETPTGPTDLATLLAEGHGVLLDLSGGALPLSEFLPWSDRVDLVSGKPTAEVDAQVLLLRPDGRVALADRDPVPDGVYGALGKWFGPPKAGS